MLSPIGDEAAATGFLPELAGGAVDTAGGVDAGGAVEIPGSGAEAGELAGELGGVVSAAGLVSGPDFESDDAELQPTMAAATRGINVQGRSLMSIWVPSDVC